MKVAIIIEVYEECADPDHEMGLTEEAHMGLYSGELPGDIVDVRKVNE